MFLKYMQFFKLKILNNQIRIKFAFVKTKLNLKDLLLLYFNLASIKIKMQQKII